MLVNQDQIQEPNDQLNVENKWNIFKTSILTALQKTLPKKMNDKKKIWKTEKILVKMSERRKFKNSKDIEKYDRLNREIIHEYRAAKTQYLEDQCKIIEDLEKTHKSKELHDRINKVTNSKKQNRGSGNVKDKDGNILFDQDLIASRWVEYISDLYDDKNRPEMPTFNETPGNSILKEEVERVIRDMKHGKATGPDELSAEALKALDEINVKLVTELCNRIYDSGCIPTELKQSSFVPIPKKPKAQNCSEYRTICLMSHVTKLLFKIIQKRIVRRIEEEISHLQSGFRSGMGTRDGIFNFRVLCEKALEINQDVYICFIDYTKAFDKVKHHMMIECLTELGIPNKELQIITEMYWEQRAVIRTGKSITAEFEIKKGVRQGCVLSPMLFNLYTEKIFREVENMTGITIGGVNINNFRYADDTVLFTFSSKDLQSLVDKVNETGKPYGMEMNVVKTKAMVISNQIQAPKVNIMIQGRSIEQVSEMVYLGSLLTDNGKCEKEIRRRIGMARTAFTKLKTVLTSRNIKLCTRIKLTKCYVWSTLLYGCETWTLSTTSIKKIEAFEMWTLRRLFKIPWTNYKTNKEVLQLAGTERSLTRIAKERKLK